MDDSDDEQTASMVREEFPAVRYFRLGCRRGPCFQRNRGAERATADILFPIDDDAVMVSAQTVEQVLGEFDDPCVGAVAIPYINIRQDRVVRQCPPDSDEAYVVHAFVGAAHAIRRDVFLELGGYREHFFYMGEEGDLCLRMMARGYLTRLGRSDPMEHHESAQRDIHRARFAGRRNDILFAWQNVPMPYLPLHLFGTMLNGVLAAFRYGNFWAMMAGMTRGYCDCTRSLAERNPVSVQAYRLQRRLKKRGPCPLSKIEPWIRFGNSLTSRR
jgi:GT2 family glycosyltransferase